MACLTARTGSLIFAIVNLYLVILLNIGSIVALILRTTAVLYFDDIEQLSPYRELLETIANHGGIHLCMFISLVCLVCASFLLNGILKGKPEHMKVYFIFGVVIALVSVWFIAGAAVILVENSYIAVIGVLFAYFVYSLILYMIHCAYRQLELSKTQYKHQQIEISSKKDTLSNLDVYKVLPENLPES